MGGFLALVGFAAIVVGIISVIRPIQRLGIRSRGVGALVLVGGIILFGLGGAFLPDPEPADAPPGQTAAADPSPTPEPTSASEPEPAPAPAVEHAPAPEEQELTEDVVRQLAGMDDITQVEILGEDGQRIVHVYYPLGTIWDEDHGVERAADKALDVFEGLFTHPEVAEVVTYAQGEFVDQYGNESTETAVRITWSRETAEKVNWENFRRMAASEPERVYNLADSYAFHPGFYNGVQNKRGLSMFGSK